MTTVVFRICCGILEIGSIYLDKIEIVRVINIFRENVILLLDHAICEII